MSVSITPNPNVQGPQGLTGTQGTQGVQGTTGIQGNNGVNGAQGTTGLQGLTGLQGTQGLFGTQGTGGQVTPATFNAQTASYTLVAGDVNKWVTMSNASANNLTVPASTFTTGQIIYVQQIGAGQTTIVASGVTITSTPGLKLRAQYSSASILCTGTNTFTVVGDLSA